MNITRLLKSLSKHEGLRLKVYRDTEGHLTIGFGRNLETLEITEEQAHEWLVEDSAAAADEAERFPEYQYLDNDVRQNVFIELVYNMGAPKVRQFRKMLAAITVQNWTVAAAEMMDSKWARQVGQRSETLATMMRTGTYPDGSS